MIHTPECFNMKLAWCNDWGQIEDTVPEQGNVFGTI